MRNFRGVRGGGEGVNSHDKRGWHREMSALGECV
mgnify:FL=1